MNTQTKRVKLVALALSIMIILTLIAIGTVYYYKVDYFLPPAMSLALIPLVTQLYAALGYISRSKRLEKLKCRAKGIEFDNKENGRSEFEL